jgi:hypothetical protein
MSCRVVALQAMRVVGALLPLTLVALALGACSSRPDSGLAPPVVDAPALTETQSPVASTSAFSPASASVGSPEASADVGTIVNDAKQHPALLAIAGQYGSFARADGTHWSQLDCRAPPDDPAHLSSAAEGTAHGRKVFVLRLFDFETYARETGGRAPAPSTARLGQGRPVPGVEQALVKVSYEPTEDAAKAQPFAGIAPAVHQGKRYYPGEQKDLFVMYRPTDKSVATDDGWLYGTVSPDGKRVSSAGLVKSCMGCHEKAPNGRQFGVK